MQTLPNCTECNKPGGTVPHYYQGSTGDFEDVKEMMHEECALKRIERYLTRKGNQ